MATTKNLYESREGIAELCDELSRAWDEIQQARKSGHLSPELSLPNNVKRFALHALEQCISRSILPPVELAALFRKVLGTSDDRARDRVKFPAVDVARIERETNLKGRALVRECVRRGLNVKESTLRLHMKRTQRVTAQEDRRLFTSAPWRGGYRWFRSPNVIPIEQWRRRPQSEQDQSD